LIVVDTNVIAAFYLRSEGRETARLVWQKDADWHAPVLWISEFRNVLMLYLRRQLIEQGTFVEALTFARGSIASHEAIADTDSIVRDLALASGCTTYDCEYVALARSLGVSLITWDRQVVNAFPETAQTPEKFVEDMRERNT
jgi:predicted nucleic acid-binding protein